MAESSDGQQPISVAEVLPSAGTPKSPASSSIPFAQQESTLAEASPERALILAAMRRLIGPGSFFIEDNPDYPFTHNRIIVLRRPDGTQYSLSSGDIVGNTYSKYPHNYVTISWLNDYGGQKGAVEFTDLREHGDNRPHNEFQSWIHTNAASPKEISEFHGGGEGTGYTFRDKHGHESRPATNIEIRDLAAIVSSGEVDPVATQKAADWWSKGGRIARPTSQSTITPPQAERTKPAQIPDKQTA